MHFCNRGIYFKGVASRLTPVIFLLGNFLSYSWHLYVDLLVAWYIISVLYF